MYNNPYFNPQRFQPMQNPYYQPMQQTMNAQTNLLGKVVESLDVVKAIDIVLDGSVNYFPLSDGSAIVTKQLQADGTSKMVVYKPTQENKKVNYLTIETLEEALNEIQDVQDMKQDIKEIKKQLKGKEMKKNVE